MFQIQRAFGIFMALGLVVWSAPASALSLNLGAGERSDSERAQFVQALRSLKSGVRGNQLEIGLEPSALPLPTLPTLPMMPRSPFASFAASAPSGGDWNSSYQKADQNGDIYMLWGDLGDEWTEKEYDKFYVISKWLVMHHFRSIINPAAFEVDVREAVRNPKTAGILWSSHGSQEGRIFATNDIALAKDVFSDGASPSFRHLVLSNCYGDATVGFHSFPSQLTYHHWTGETRTEEFFDYLLSAAWTRDLEHDLGIRLESAYSPLFQ